MDGPSSAPAPLRVRAFPPEARSLRLFLAPAAYVLAVAIFAVDLSFPAGYAVALLYVVVIVLALWTPGEGLALRVAALATVLTVLDFSHFSGGGDLRTGLFNRSLILLVLWVTALGVTAYRRAVERERQTIKGLQDTQYALNQSAIVSRTDVGGRIVDVNDKFCEISGYTRDELIGRDHSILNSSFHAPEFFRDMYAAITSGRVWRGEIRNRARDGSFYWVDTTIVPFLDEARRPYQYTAIHHDVTDKKRHEQQLRDQAALARVGEMAAVVAHEVRNPLAGIRGGIQLLASMQPPGFEGGELIHDMVARIDSLNGVISDLLTFAGQRELKPARVEIALFLTDLANSLKLDPLMAAIDWRHPDDAGIVIDGDPDQLRVVFTNLLVNSAQALQGRGRIVIDVSSKPTGECLVTLTDSGPGIPPEIRHRVFEPFFTTRHQGTGLGLAIVRRILEAHGASIELACPPGGGTVATVTWPARVVAPV